MMPYDTYRLYQAERVKSPREIHHPAGLSRVRAIPGHHADRAQATPGRARRRIPPDSTGRIPGHDGRGDGGLVTSLLIQPGVPSIARPSAP